MAKTNNNKKGEQRKGRRTPRTMALAMAEPRLRETRQPHSGPADASEHRDVGRSAQAQRPTELYELMLSCSPWTAMLHQQVLLAKALSSMVDVQQHLAEAWRLPVLQAEADRHKRR